MQIANLTTCLEKFSFHKVLSFTFIALRKTIFSYGTIFCIKGFFDSSSVRVFFDFHFYFKQKLTLNGKGGEVYAF